MSNARLTFLVPLALLAASIAVLLLLSSFDRHLFALMNSCHSPITDMIWLALTAMGDGLVLGIIVGAFIVVNPRVVAVGIPLLLLTSLLVNSIKAVFPSLRPAELLEAVHVVGPLLRSGAFPSGHAASAVAAALSVSFYCPIKPVALATGLIAALIGISRVFVGAHFPKDVLGGMVCAIVLFLLLSATIRPTLESRVPDRPIFGSKVFQAAFCLEVVATMFTIFIYAPYYSEYAPVPIAIGVAVLGCLAMRYESQPGPTTK